MRLASHILAVFVAISTIVSPCLASIKASKADSARLQKAVLASLQIEDIAHSAQSIEEISELCNGPCARLLNARNIQTVRSVITTEFDTIVPVVRLIQPSEPDNVPAIRKLSSLTNWNGVNIYHLCRQLN